MFLEDGAVGGAKLGARGLEIGRRRQPAEELGHPVHAPVDHRRVEMVRAGDDVGDDLGFLRIRHRRLEHANDRRRPIAQADGPADDGWVAPEARSSRTGASGRPRPSAFGPSSPGVEQAAHDRPQAHDLEIRSADDAGANGARVAEPDHRELDGREIAEGGDGFHPRLQVAELRHREVGVLDADALGRLADVDQAVLVAVDQRAAAARRGRR